MVRLTLPLELNQNEVAFMIIIIIAAAIITLLCLFYLPLNTADAFANTTTSMLLLQCIYN